MSVTGRRSRNDLERTSDCVRKTHLARVHVFLFGGKSRGGAARARGKRVRTGGNFEISGTAGADCTHLEMQRKLKTTRW